MTGGWFGIGRQTTDGPVTAPTRYYKFLSSTQEECSICERVDERSQMHFTGSDEYGAGIYVCNVCNGAHLAD